MYQRQWREVIRRHNAGEPISAITQEFNISRARIRRLVRDSIDRKDNNVPPQYQQDVIDLYSSDIAPNEIAQKLGMKRGKVTRFIKEGHDIYTGLYRLN